MRVGEQEMTHYKRCYFVPVFSSHSYVPSTGIMTLSLLSMRCKRWRSLLVSYDCPVLESDVEVRTMGLVYIE
jgi:hypothetical protein